MSGNLAGEVAPIGGGAVSKITVSFQKGEAGEKFKEITLDSGITEKPYLEAFASTMSIETTYEIIFEEAVEVT